MSRGSWHWFLPPGVCIVLVVVAGFFIIRGAEEVLFPKLQELTGWRSSPSMTLDVEYRTPRGALRAVDGASFDVPDGAVVGLVGESGCGKTTLARAIIGVMPRNARIAGGASSSRAAISRRSPSAERRDMRWRDIAFVPQSAMNSLDPVYRVGAQIQEVLVDARRLRRAPRRDARAAVLFQMVGLDPAAARRLSAPVLRRHAPARRRSRWRWRSTRPRRSPTSR